METAYNSNAPYPGKPVDWEDTSDTPGSPAGAAKAFNNFGIEGDQLPGPVKGPRLSRGGFVSKCAGSVTLAQLRARHGKDV